MEKSFKLSWPLAIVVIIGLIIAKGTLFTKGDINLAITDDVLETKWKPYITKELKNYYNEKYMAPLASRGASAVTEMAALSDRIDQLKITSLTLEQRGARTTSWSIGNSSKDERVTVKHEMPGGTPDNITKRELLIKVRGTNDISRIERL